jgi:microcin C transport system substrate-binding protein
MTGHATAIGRAAARATGLLVVALASVLLGAPARAEFRHGLSAFGDLKYPADFKHFDYVNPDAPKGGRLSTIGTEGRTTFDSFNGFLLKGDAAQGIEYLFDTLMTRAGDEPDAVYGLVASAAEIAPNGKSVTFQLRPEAKFADGSPLTADDVVFSFDTLKAKGHPRFGIALRDVDKAEAPDAHTVRYTFKGDLTRDLPLVIAELPILSKAYYTAHPFDQTSLEPPLGSGPYAIGDFKAGTYVIFKRRPDYWAKDLPVSVGRFNFDELRYDYFRDRRIELENLFSGNVGLREEFTSLDWATAYENVPAIKDGRIQRATLPDERPSGTQGFFLNTRREQFKDIRVREAMDLAFDFEWSNKNLFYSLYKRTQSFLENSPMKASGLPTPEELKLLEPFRDKLPPEVFGDPYVPPVTDGSGRNRDNLKKAKELLTAAGYGGAEAGGKTLKVEILIFEDGFERIIGPYINNLKKIGVDATIRLVDSSQYERRMKSFDFDVAIERYVLRLTPGVELKTYWGSQAAKMEGSFNLAGIQDPVLDALTDRAIEAKSRAELVAACRALDRVLRAGHYWVPQWYKAAHNIAFWNRYSWPKVKAKYDEGIIDTWWYDADKTAKLDKN